MTANFPSRYRPIIYLALAALLGLSLWLRLRFIQTVQLYPDEFVTLLAIKMIGQKGLPVMPSGLFYDHGLLFSYVGSLAAWLGPVRWTARYASMLFGLATLGLTFWLGRRWLSSGVGLIAVTGLAIAPVAIEWSSRARMYALLQLLVLLTLWLAYEGIVQNRASLRWAALLAYLGATLTHFVAVTLAPPVVLAGIAIWWSERRGSEEAKRRQNFSCPRLLARFASPHLLAEAAVFILILAAAFLVKRAGQPKGIEALDASGALPGLGQVFSIYSNFSFNLIDGWQAIAPFYLTLPALIFAPFALIVIAISLINLFFAFSPPRLLVSSPPRFPASSPPSPRPPTLFLSLILLTTTLEMILFVSPDRRDDKYLFMLLPVLLLLGAQGMKEIGDWRLNLISNLQYHKGTMSLISSLLPLLISGLILMFTQPAVQALLSNTGDDYDSAFAYVQAHWQEGDTILTGTPAAAVFYLDRNDFYGVQRQGGYDYRLLTVNGQAVDRWLGSPAVRTEAELHETLANHRVWLVLERWGLQREYYDLPFQQQLLTQTDYVSEVQGIFILRSQANSQPLRLDPAYALEANFGNQIRLTGYTVEPEQPVPGQSLRLTLYWQALTAIPHDYTVFVHLRQPDGGNVAQADHRPLEPFYPTHLWPPSETIRESSRLDLPATLSPGEYELWVGLYLLETGERLPVQADTSGENAVSLGKLTVKP